MQPDEDILELEEKEERAALAVGVMVNQLCFISQIVKWVLFLYSTTFFYALVKNSV